MRYHVLVPPIEAASDNKGRNVLWYSNITKSFKELNHMVSSESLLNYPDWKTPFVVYTDASDKQLGAVIGHNHKPIDFSQEG